MKRRSLLKAAGLAAIADVERVAVDQATATGDHDGPATGAVFERLAPLAASRGSVAAVARGRAVDPPEELQVGARVTAAGGGLTDDAGVRIWYGPDPDRVLAHLREQGFRPVEALDDHAAVARTGRGRVRLVVAGADATLVGRGPSTRPVAEQLRRLVEGDGPTVPEASARADEPADAAGALSTLVGHLGDGVAAVVQRPDAPPAPRADGARPVLSGERVALREGEAKLRRVAVYPSRTASLAARERDWGPWPAEGTVERTGVARTGRAVVRDAVATDPRAVLDGPR